MNRRNEPPRLTILAIGEVADPHFAAVAPWLANHSSARVWFSADANLHRDVEPALIVLFQSRPGQFTASEIATLRSRWPLARFISLAGSWCGGEGRSGKPIPGVYRVPWDSTVARISRELQSLRTGRGALALPATATFEERAAANDAGRMELPGPIAVAAMSAAYAEPVVESIAAAGCPAFYWSLGGGSVASRAAAAVWDVTGCEGRFAYFHARLPSRATGAPLVALANFPRPQDFEMLTALGVTQILGKPFHCGDLFACLGATVSARAADAA